MGHHAENGMSILSLKTKKVKKLYTRPKQQENTSPTTMFNVYSKITQVISGQEQEEDWLFLTPNTEEFIWLGEKSITVTSRL